MSADVLGLIPPSTAVAEVSTALHKARAVLDERLRAGFAPVSLAVFGARRKLETNAPAHDVITVDVESPARELSREKFAAHLREVAERCSADWVLLVLPGRAFIADLEAYRPVVMFVVEVKGSPTESYVAIVDPTATVVTSFARIAHATGFESFRFLLGVDPRTLN